MSEQQNTALIQKLYDAFAQGDVQTILDNLTDDVEWTLEGPSIIPFAGKRKGPSQVLGFFQALAGTQQNMKLTTDVWAAQGDVVATLGRYSGTVTATGKSFDTAVAHFFTIRGGKVSRFVDVGDTAQFAEAYTGGAAAKA
jgi:ketosteroid isomerase-like protein